MAKSSVFSDRKRSVVFIDILIVCIAASALMTALATALPTMATDLGVDVNTIQWVTSGYTLALGIMTPLTAYLITRFHTRPLFLWGIVVFIIGLAISVFAPNFIIMMFGRVLQACGSGLLISMGQVIILSIFPDENKGTAMGWYGLAMAAAPIVAPTIAGILVDTAGWRTIFILVLIIMIVCLIVTLTAFDTALPTEKEELDVFSVVISVLAFGGLTLGIGNIGTYAFASAAVLVPLIIGGIALVIFIFRQLHLEHPFLELRTFRTRNYALSVIASMLMFMILMGSSIIMPLYAQNIKECSATVSGLVSLPGALTTAVFSLVAGKIYDRIGIKKLFLTGAVCMLAGNILMSLVPLAWGVWVVAVINIVRCVASGFLTMTLITWGVSTLKPELTAHATVLLNTFRTIAGAVGSAVFVGIMTMVGENSVEKYGEAAAMHGYNMAFTIMAIESVFLLLIPVLFLRKEKQV